MPKRRLLVNVDTWGHTPAFTRGQVVEVDTDDKDNPFPYNIDWAVGNGTVLDLDAQEELNAAEANRVARPGSDVPMAARLPSGDAGVINWSDRGVSRHEYLTAEQQAASVAGEALGAGVVLDQGEPSAPGEPPDTNDPDAGAPATGRKR
jgi:hypothetical protein